MSARLCILPAAANSLSENDCTPKLTRPIPPFPHAAAFSSSTVSGSASSVTSSNSALPASPMIADPPSLLLPGPVSLGLDRSAFLLFSSSVPPLPALCASSLCVLDVEKPPCDCILVDPFAQNTF